MPYIKREQRKIIDAAIKELVKQMKSVPVGDDVRKGVFNYALTRIMLGLMDNEIKYGKVNDLFGAIECCKLEFYRRLAAVYEDKKVCENGDVFDTEYP